MNKKYWLRGGVLLVAIQLVYIIVSRIFSTSPQSIVEGILEKVLFPPNLVGLGFTFTIGTFAGWLYGKIKYRGTERSIEPPEKLSRYRYMYRIAVISFCVLVGIAVGAIVLNPYWVVINDSDDLRKVDKIILASSDPNTCEKVMGIIVPLSMMFPPDVESYCNTNMAIKLKDASVCNNLQLADQKYWSLMTHDRRSDCYSEVALAQRNASICNDPDNLFIDNCLFNVARGLKDESLCDLAKDPYRRACHERFTEERDGKEI